MHAVIRKWGIVLFEASWREGSIFKERSNDGTGILQRGDGKGVKMVTRVKVIKDEFVIVVWRQLEEAGRAFNSYGRIGRAEGDVTPLFGPGEMGDEVECFLVSTQLGVSKFAGFSVF